MKAETREFLRDVLQEKMREAEEGLVNAAKYGWESVDTAAERVSDLWEKICDFEEDDDE